MWSLPPVIPHDVGLTWYSVNLSHHTNCKLEDLWSHPYHRPHPDSIDTSQANNDGLNTQGIGVPNRRSANNPPPGTRSILAQLKAEEAVIEQRKQNIRRFGAGWLRPPGVPKTYQQMMDEEAERKEQAEIARREALMNELAAAEQSQHLAADGAGDGTDEGMEERDLDADVPDADADADEEDDGEEEQDVTFNEESLLEGSEVVDAQEEEDMLSQHMIRLEEAELDGRLQEERELGLERDLDNDVPEAGSWEHTDTEEEIESTDHDMMAAASAARTSSLIFRGSSQRLMGSSSFVNDSPVVARPPRRGSAWGHRMARGGRRLGS